jgi:hypothetical protein
MALPSLTALCVKRLATADTQFILILLANSR